MLHTIKNRKFGRNVSQSEVHWANLFSESEDSMTSSIIGTLMHLETTHIWEIFNSALGVEVFDTKIEIEDILFWPRWEPQYTGNANYVEPDVLIRTQLFDLIIEVKNNCRQDECQWKRELIAYQNVLSEDGIENIVFIALGGNANEGVTNINLESFTNEKLPESYQLTHKIYKLNWDRLFSVCQDFRRKFQLSNKPQLTRIFNDIISYFEIHGYLDIKFIKDIDYPKHKVHLHKHSKVSSIKLIFKNNKLNYYNVRVYKYKHTKNYDKR